MLRKVWIGFLFLLALAVGAVLLLDIAYFFHGSLEWYPTDEQQEKVKIVTAIIAILLAVVETVIVALLLRLFRKGLTVKPSGTAGGD